MTRSDQLYLEEFAAESADLMRRALAYAAAKRAIERAKITGVTIQSGFFNGREMTGSTEQRSQTKKKIEPKRKGRKSNRDGYVLDGERRSLAEWCEIHGLKEATVLSRLQKGMTFEAAMREPLKRRGAVSNRGRDPKIYVLNGESKSLTQWAEQFGIIRTTLQHRLWRGIPFEEAVALALYQKSDGSKSKNDAARVKAEENQQAGGGSEISDFE